MKYYISGDGTGITYGIHATEDYALPFSGKVIEAGFKSLIEASNRIRELERKPKKPLICESCGVNRADPPSKLCSGCQAYREHQQ